MNVKIKNTEIAFYNKFSVLLNSNKFIISVIDMTISDNYCILALDSYGILNVWIVKENIFSFGNNNNDDNHDEVIQNDELIDFSDIKVLYPDCAFDVKPIVNDLDADVSNNTPTNPHSTECNFYFSKMEKIIDQFILICGEFNTFLIRKEQIEKKIHNFLLSINVNNVNNKSNGQSKILNIQKLDADITLNDYTKSNNSLINGVDFDNENNQLLSYSDNGNAILYDINTCDIINSFNLEDFNQFKYYDSPSSILTGKIIIKENKIVLGTSDGNLNILEYSTMKHLGFHNVCINKYFSTNDLEKEITNEFEFNFRESINSIECCSNYLIIGCNRFAFKYNLQLNLITQIIPTLGKVNSNSITTNFQSDQFLIGTNDKILNYNTNGKIISETKVSSPMVYNLSKLEIYDRQVFCASGNSSYIDIFADDILFKLIY